MELRRVLFRPGFTRVGVDDQIVRAAVRLLRHERPFEAGREAVAAAAAYARLLHLLDDPVAALEDDFPGAVPVAARTRTFQPPIAAAVEVGESPVRVSQHQPSPASRRVLDRKSTRLNSSH